MTVQAPTAPGGGLFAAIGRSEYPVLGVVAVMLGAFISSLNTRITTFGLADIRGGLSFGFDEASWITTVFGAAQMVVTPAAAWMSTVLSTRRVLLWTGTIFTAASAFRFVFSQNIAGALEGWYSESGRWEWIFWQNVVLTPVMLALVLIAMPRRTDWVGIIFAGIGFGLIYAGLDQGNRLDWLSSGIVTGLLLAGSLLVVTFLVHEARTEYPLIHLRIMVRRNVAVPALLISIYGFGSMATGFILPDYLTRIQGLRDLQIGDTLNWIALPQIVLVPLVSLLLKRIDARLVLVFGFAMIAIGSWMDTGLTHDWAGGDFLPSQCVEAIGLAFAITALITYAISHITPAQAAAIAATIQIARLFGSEVGSAVIQTFVRVREQTYSNLIGLHLIGGSEAAEGVATQLAGPFGSRPTGLGDPAAQGLVVLAIRVQREAFVLAYIDAFWLVAWVSLFGILLVLLLRRSPPNPLTPPRITP